MCLSVEASELPLEHWDAGMYSIIKLHYALQFTIQEQSLCHTFCSLDIYSISRNNNILLMEKERVYFIIVQYYASLYQWHPYTLFFLFEVDDNVIPAGNCFLRILVHYNKNHNIVLIY